VSHLKHRIFRRSSQSLQWLVRACIIYISLVVLYLLFLSAGFAHASEYANLSPRTSRIARISFTATPLATSLSTPTPPVTNTQVTGNAINWTTIITSIAPIIVVVLSGVIAALGYLYKHEKERREEIERQLSEHKYKTYMALMNTYIEVITIFAVSS